MLDADVPRLSPYVRQHSRVVGHYTFTGPDLGDRATGHYSTPTPAVGSLVGLTARFFPGMISRDRGGVLNVASTAAFQPVPTMAVYAATKAFVLSFTEALWGETRGTGVRVVTLCPGATETAFFDNTGKNFLTGGRQTPAQVARVALRALNGSSPSVVSGLSNRLGATGYRFLPRAVMVRLSGNAVKESV